MKFLNYNSNHSNFQSEILKGYNRILEEVSLEEMKETAKEVIDFLIEENLYQEYFDEVQSKTIIPLSERERTKLQFIEDLTENKIQDRQTAVLISFANANRKYRDEEEAEQAVIEFASTLKESASEEAFDFLYGFNSNLIFNSKQAIRAYNSIVNVIEGRDEYEPETYTLFDYILYNENQTNEQRLLDIILCNKDKTVDKTLKIIIEKAPLKKDLIQLGKGLLNFNREEIREILLEGNSRFEKGQQQKKQTKYILEMEIL